MGALGGLYRPTPQGYNGNLAGRGPSRQCLWPPSSPPTAGARRLVGPTDWSGTEPTGRVRRGRVLPAADYCSHNANDAGLVRGAWLQSRRLAGDHCSHSASYLVNGVWAPEEGPGRLLGAGLSGGRLPRVGLSWSRLLAVGRPASRPPEGGTSSWRLEGRS